MAGKAAKTTIVGAAAVALVTGGAIAASAGSSSSTHRQAVGAERAGTAANLTSSASGISKVAVATSAGNDISTSTKIDTLLPGMSVRITVPARHKALLISRFSAESACYGGDANPNWCIAKVLVDGVEASPGDGSDFAFDSTDNGTESSTSWESHALERASIVGPGVHTVKVVGAVTDFGGTGAQVFWTGERTLVVERALL